ncbi:N-6 DNA methylase [Paracoccaceae bacterium]|nr:N-6 DNA methylase [Paracoccaceae bacterium]
MARKPITDMSAWPSLTLEGGLIAPAMIAKIDQRAAPEQAPEDYSVRKGLRIREEISTAFRVGQFHFEAFSKLSEPSQDATKRFISGLFKETFGFDDLAPELSPVAMSASARVPVVIVPSSETLDRRSPTLSIDRSRSAAFALQDYLNEKDDALWGIATNGMTLRLMRDNASLTRPAYIEADLAQIFNNEDIASFALLWLLIHRSRFGSEGTPATDCALERWRDAGSKEGEVARDRLAGQVQIALKVLGSGFLEANPELAVKLNSGEINLTVWFNELLRLIYRLIFLMVAEDRNLLHPEKSKVEARALYAQGYSLAGLRKQCYRAATWDRHHDRYEGLKIVFKALSQGQKALALPALGGLFAQGRLPRLETAILRNKAFMEALYRLSWLSDKNGMVPVNWRSMETEELGSVYETLLELQPQLGDDGKSLIFASDVAEQKGNQRKTTGSYYTPDSLVQVLLDTALDPVLDKVETESEDPAKALLKLSVIDPACGSGHFLLAAARRIATRLARHRAEGTPALSDFRHALRDVARSCLHGVDRNPMAVELTKVALWIETVDPGLPLGFFDAQIRCGDALLGVFDLKVLEDGIPDAAYKPLTGDDKDAAKYYKKANQDATKGQGGFDFGTGQVAMPEMKPMALDFSGFRDLPEDTVEQIGAKAKRFRELRKKQGFVRATAAANLYVAAFLLPKVGGAPAGPSARTVPTTEELWMALNQGKMRQAMVDAPKAARSARAFHWPLEFPDVMQRGGFDVVLGNPPWEKLTLFEREFFSAHPEISDENNAARRKKAIKELLERNLSMSRKWNDAQYSMVALGNFMRGAHRFPFTAVGDLNLYALFTELSTQLNNKKGATGLVLKSAMFTGSTWRKFTDHLITTGKLYAVFDFKNWETLFSGVGYHERFCLATLLKGSFGKEVHLSVGLTNPSQLSEAGRTLKVDKSFPRLVNPDTGTLPQCETSEQLLTLSRVASEFPTVASSDWDVRYTRGLDMTADAAHMVDRETLEDKGYALEGNWFLKGRERFAPVYEGKFLQQYNHRFATFDGIPRERRFGVKAATMRPSVRDYQDYNYEILPRYWVSEQYASDDAWKRKISTDWNLSFRHTTNVISNFRTAIGCIVGPTAFSYQSPNLVISGGDARETALFLSVFNSVPYDNILRTKFYGANLTKGLLMQSFIIKRSELKPFEDELVETVCKLSNTSGAISVFADNAGHPVPTSLNEGERQKLIARIDAIMFTLFGFDAEAAKGIFETFPIWRDKQIEAFGSFVSQELTIEEMSRI